MLDGRKVSGKIPFPREKNDWKKELSIRVIKYERIVFPKNSVKNVQGRLN